MTFGVAPGSNPSLQIVNHDAAIGRPGDYLLHIRVETGRSDAYSVPFERTMKGRFTEFGSDLIIFRYEAECMAIELFE